MRILTAYLAAQNGDLPVTFDELDTVPTGHEYDVAKSYYHWLWGNYLSRWREQWVLDLSEAFLQQITVGFTMIGFFWLFAYYFNQVHRSKKNLYKPVFYGGTVTERHGKFGPFSIIVTVAIALWGLFYGVTHVLLGQIY